MIGSGGIATTPICGRTLGSASPIVGFSDDMLTREQQLIQPWAWLEFYEIETVQSGTLRYVDMQDPDAGGVPANLLPFNGNNYKPRKIKRSAIKSAEGVPQFSLEVEDVGREFIDALELDDGLNGQKITLHVIPYDLIAAKPYLARTESFRIRSAGATISPDRITLSVGLPSLADYQIPHRMMTRNRCSNDYNRRFELDGLCRAPSDDFEAGTAQMLGSAFPTFVLPSSHPSAATKRRFGWSTINADRARHWHTSQSTVEAGSEKPWTQCLSVFADLRWEAGQQNGLFAWKDISGDFSLETRVKSTGDRTARLVGLLIQDAASLGDWMFWGQSEDGVPADIMRVRESVSGTPTDVDFDLTDGDERIRVVRIGDDFTAYSRITDAGAWVSKNVFSWTTPPEKLRVGLLAASDTVDGVTSVLAYFRHFRFTVGGFVTCDRSRTDCVERDNFHQFNAFPSIPRNRTRG